MYFHAKSIDIDVNNMYFYVKNIVIEVFNINLGV